MSLEFCDFCENMFDPEEDEHITECPEYSDYQYENFIDNQIESERGK